MQLSCASIDLFLDSLSVQGASDETIRAYRSDLNGFLNWMNRRGLTTDRRCPPHLETHAAQFLTEGRKTWAAKTTLRKLTTIRSWARHEGDPDFLKDYRAPTAAAQEPHPLPEGIDGVNAMLAVAFTPQKAALVALCGLMGLRVSEACSIRPADIDISKMEIRVVGKGSKTRFVPISARTWTHLEPAVLSAAVDGTTLVRVQQRSARASITSMGRRARLTRRVASHDLRATFATAALERTKDLRAVQELLGHASVTTTQIYTSISEARKREAVEAL